MSRNRRFELGPTPPHCRWGDDGLRPQRSGGIDVDMTQR